MLDVRAETLRLSAEVAQLRLYGSAGAGRGGRGRHVDGDGWKRDEGAVQLSLQEIEDKVCGWGKSKQTLRQMCVSRLHMLVGCSCFFVSMGEESFKEAFLFRLLWSICVVVFNIPTHLNS